MFEMDFECKYCHNKYVSKRSLGMHIWHCSLNPNHKEIWNKGKTKDEDKRILNGVINREKSFNEGKWEIKPFHHSDITKKIISQKRKEWLKRNPDKHPWRSKNKQISKPCEYLKSQLRSKSIQFIEEYDPKIEGHNFSLDIAFPDEKIAIEVNGNQHYNNDGSLRDYYQNRHNILEKNGWKIFEIHYTKCYNFNINILNGINFYDKEYVNKYFSKKEEKKIRNKKEKEEKENEKIKIYNLRRNILLDLLYKSNINFKKQGWVNKSFDYLENKNIWFHNNMYRQIKKYIPDHLNEFFIRKS